MRHRLLTAAVSAVVVVLALTGCSMSVGAEETSEIPDSTVGNLDSFYAQRIKWEPCEGAFVCAWFDVPLNYADPDAGAIKLRALKSAAHDKSRRRGALVLNPGGPGASGYQFALYSSSAFTTDVVASYDIVGFDPRGVGKSSPITCLSNEQTDRVLSTLGTPVTQEQADAAAESAALIGQTCDENSPSLTPQVGTVPAARDMDILRQLIGEPKLNFFGSSYGTFLGLTYADLFTDKIGQFVLDGVIDPALTNARLLREQGEGFQHALERFVDDCNGQVGCPLPPGREAGIARINALLASVSSQPMKALPGRPLTRPLATTALASGLYDNASGWAPLATALRAAFGGNGGPMLELADSFNGRTPQGTYPENRVDSSYAVNCLDRLDSMNPEETWEAGKEWSQTASTFGADLAWSGLPCFGWPAPPTDYPHAISAQGSPKILLIGNLHDPATPYLWAKAVSGQLANSYLLTADIDGHTAYNRSSCVTAHVDDVLLRGKFPPAGTTCSD